MNGSSAFGFSGGHLGIKALTYFLRHRMKESGEQVDDRIAEVVWVTNEGEPRWRLLRFRDDKPHGNYVDVVEGICRSIADGVEQEDVSSFILLWGRGFFFDGCQTPN